MIKIIRKLIENVYKYHSEIIQGNIYKEYIENEVILYVDQKGNNLYIRALNNSTQRSIYLGANKYKKLLEQLSEIGEIKKNYINRAINIDLYNKIEVHKLINEKSDGKIKELEHEIIDLKKKLKIAENTISSLREENLVYKKKNIRNAGRKEKFTEKEKEKIRERRKGGAKLKDLALEFNCSVGMIHKILS